jgi:2-dehydropantoate 2-reductase
MKIAVIGCGAIGGLFLGYLTEQGCDVRGVVRQYQKEILTSDGLFIEGVRGEKKVSVNVDTRLKEQVDLAIFATKIDNLEESIQANGRFFQEACILTTQNGIKSDYIVREYFPDHIVTGIVMFGATYYPPNRIVQNFDGDLILGSMFGENIKNEGKVLQTLQYTFNVVMTKNIRGAKYLKLFVNLNNCFSGLLGISMQEAFSDLEIAALAFELNREAYRIIRGSRIKLASMPSYPKERIKSLISMDAVSGSILLSKVITSLSKEPLYGSILQSIKRGQKSEIDYINGEIVRLSRTCRLSAPLNEKIVQLVHQVENSGIFLTKEKLSSAIKSS